MLVRKITQCFVIVQLKAMIRYITNRKGIVISVKQAFAWKRARSILKAPAAEAMFSTKIR